MVVIIFKIYSQTFECVKNQLVGSVLTSDYFMFKQLVKNIVQNHVLDHLKCYTSLALQTYGFEHAIAHFRLMLWHVLYGVNVLALTSIKFIFGNVYDEYWVEKKNFAISISYIQPYNMSMERRKWNSFILSTT